MMYTELINKALKISFEAHRNQKDLAGVPYVYHPYEVARCMNDEHSICTALLHDVIEDAGITPEYLQQEGFPQEVIDALLCLTHDKDVPYLDYIANVKKNRIARKVKLADLEHNSDISRFEKPSEEDCSRVEKYKMAIELLLK